MIRLKSADEIARIREAGAILADTMQGLEGLIDEGTTTADLDRFARDKVVAAGAVPAFLGYLDYPATLCVSVNDEVIHGIPGSRKLREGDIVGVDLGVDLGGYIADAAWTFPVGSISASRARLLATTRLCLDDALRQIRKGARMHDIAEAVSSRAEQDGFGVVRQFCGHGVGFAPHEDPQVPNYVSRGPNPRLKTGMVLAIEPMLNSGGWEVEVLEDGWTVKTIDGSDSAHFEYTVAVVDGGVDILTPLPWPRA